MKNLTVIAVMIFSVIICSCGGSSTNEDKKDDAIPEKTVLDTREAMMAKLAEYQITIPEDMVFREIEKQVYLSKDFEDTDTHIIHFSINDKDKVNKDELTEWYNNQRKILKDQGWVEKTYDKDKEMMGGGSYSVSVLEKKSENCVLDIRLVFNDNGSSIIIHPKYEIS
ncbi:MAG: hypothetical protein ACLFN1_06915 [Bacteroidales bacterium]